ncbi:BPTD_3080 family restriction endonuclease [Chthonobacter rhizosphaerae]|uniref:BPTD_3080 family restriction endonuclease n=1 Tax=Chthonobacter rhizosphaerae TaxID=2735553 RepID=UPI0015EFAF8A|nr:DEAD/DEAH box helicase family protein [Chthonobacter rhizosphaerae]
MAKPFYVTPILNSPYHVPTRHHCLDEQGQPLDQPPTHGRRRSKYLTPVPKARRRRPEQAELALHTQQGEPGTYSENALVNEIRGHVASWRSLPNPNDWGVTPATQKLLQHWRHHAFQGPRPFFCQIEAAETAIWLTEVARTQRRHAGIIQELERANAEANPEIFRIALKLATGAGKTTVMAMLIAWQAVNAARSPGSKLFSRGFVIVAPGITIKDRLRVLLPSGEDSYYASRELVPPDMMIDLQKAKIVITNYHVFQHRRVLDTNQTGERLLQGRTGTPIEVMESEGDMLRRACGELLTLKNVVVLNDEAHHCYRERTGEIEEKEPLKGDDLAEAKSNNEAARLWISGLEALKRKVGVRTVYDLSATPFFLRGSGYAEGTLFPWVVSDFSLIDAIECGIVKLPRVPVSDNSVANDMPVFRNLWDHIGRSMPKKGAGKAGDLDPLNINPILQNALQSLYTLYVEENEAWQRAGIRVPPVFIVVCNNTATSKLVYEWIAGWERVGEDGEKRFVHNGHLDLFRNYDQNGNPMPRMNTLLIDSQQLDSGEALDTNFRAAAEVEIERFRREKAEREGAEAGNLSDADLLREVMNTVGREGRLGEQIRCVVSVSMLTEGWDTNTVTHVLGVRAFGTQLLCEQVIGRGLRRQSYALGDEVDAEGNRLFEAEYADILGIPFDFATEPQKVTKTPPKPVTRIQAMRDRAMLSIRFPRIAGYRTELPDDRLTATFTDNSVYRLTPAETGPCTTRLEGLVGEGVDLTPDVLDEMRPASISLHLTKRLIEKYLAQVGEPVPYHLTYKVQPIVRRWIKDCLVLEGGTKAGMLTYAEIADRAAEKIYHAIVHSVGGAGEPVVRVLLDPYNPAGVTDHVGFITTKTKLWKTSENKSHVNYVVGDSDWELEFARVVEEHPATLAYVKNQGLGLEVPYRFGSETRRYLPDFIVKVEDGHGPDDPLYLIVEIKGFRGLDAELKAGTMETLWVPGVNRIGAYGRWSFAELREPFAMQDAYAELIRSLSAGSAIPATNEAA